MILSRTDNKWYLGQIVSISGKLKNEWLTIKYNNKTKKIQRNSNYIKPINNIIDHPNKFIKGSKCQILCDNNKTIWCNGEIIDIFNDSEGEWLKIKYYKNENNNNINKTIICDIQRYSHHIRPCIDDEQGYLIKKKQYVKLLKTI